MAIHIVTDSTACLPQAYVDEHGITVVPLKVSLDGEYFRDGIDITADEFYLRLVAGAKGGSTQPSPEEFASAYRAILDKDPEGDIVSLHVSGRMSGTLNSALTGCSQLGTAHVRLVDTRSVGLGIGFPTMRAVELAETGASLSRVVAEWRRCVCGPARTSCSTPSSTSKGRAHRQGCCHRRQHPEDQTHSRLIQGVTDVVDRPRTKRVALERLWAIIDKHVQKGIEYVGFHYAANRAELEDFQREFASRYRPAEHSDAAWARRRKPVGA